MVREREEGTFKVQSVEELGEGREIGHQHWTGTLMSSRGPEPKGSERGHTENGRTITDTIQTSPNKHHLRGSTR